MSQAIGEEQTRLLQGEIRQLGAALARGRGQCVGSLVLAAALLAAQGYLWGGRLTLAGLATHFAYSTPFLALAALGAAGVGLMLVAGCRMVHRRRLRRELAALTPTQRAAVLLPLHGDGCGDVRKLVAPLLREIPRPSEVTPAPAGRGDELVAWRDVTGRHAATPHRKGGSWTARWARPPFWVVVITTAALGALPGVHHQLSSGTGVRITLPESRWSFNLYDVRSRNRPYSWCPTPLPGYSRAERMEFSFSGDTAYRVRVGNWTWELSRYRCMGMP